MKKVILFHLIILLFACNQSSENNSSSGNSTEDKLEVNTEKLPLKEEKIISNIKKKFENINQNSASYVTKSKEITGKSAEGGELKSYYQNEELKKVVASYFGEMGKSIEEYYFSEKNAFLVFTQQYSYDKPMSVEGSKVKKIDENRYYFHNNKLVRWLDPNKEKVANSNFNQKESEILQKIKELKNEMGNAKIDHLNASKKNDDNINMKSLFTLSPLSIFEETTEGLNLSEKNELIKKGESDNWKIIDENKTKLTILSKQPDSKVTFRFFKNKDNLGVYYLLK